MSFITILAGTSRRSDHRRRDVRVPAAMIEMFEPRVVLSTTCCTCCCTCTTSAPFEVRHIDANGPSQSATGLFATVPTQVGNSLQISATITNNGTTAKSATAALFNDPNPDLSPGAPGDEQTLVASETRLLAPGESHTFTFTVEPGKCYQYDTVPFDHPPTVGGSTAPGALLKNDLYMTFSRFCVPECDCECPPPTPGKVKGNEGLGNGADPPPPGHAGDLFQNDDGTNNGGVVTPGKPNKGWNK